MRKLFPPNASRTSGRLATRAFTLLEILVVIAIISILTALALSVMGRATQSARQAKAVVPLRDCAAAGLVYSAQNNGQINTEKWPGDANEGQNGQYVSDSFWGRLQPHIFPQFTGGTQAQQGVELKQRIGELFSTQNSDKMTGTILQGGSIYHDSTGLPVPFAFNKYLYQWNKWVTINDAGGPSQVIYMTYGSGFFGETDACQYVKWPTDGSKPLNPILYLPNQKAMVVFLDGHVEMLGSPIPKTLFTAN